VIAKAGKENSLAARLFVILFAAMFLSFIAATALAAYVSWTAYEGDAEERLTAQLEVVEGELQGLDSKQMEEVLARTHLADTRITLVAGDGTVLYDNMVDAREMGSHADREEIRTAPDRGEAVVLRRSETTGTDSLYAASRVNPDGTVLRLAESRASLAYYLGGLLLPLSVAVLLAALLSMLLSRVITRRITSPLLRVDLDAPLKSRTYREITPLLERIDAQRVELVRQNEQLARAVEMRREFTGNVSHEMKSPLQVIGGYAELIEEGIGSPDDARHFAGIIKSETQSMRMLIDDVLTLSRLDEGATNDVRAVDVAEWVLRVVGRLSSVAAASGVEIAVDLRECSVCCEEALLEQAVYNLVDNAVRYGDGRVEVTVGRDGEKVAIAVSDDGEGIPVDQRERVFERFYRVDASRSRSTGGTGLGLAIVKHAADAMGGRVFVGESDMGGAAFTLELPAQ
jgi:two-component system phosphate regulon sensor histidine kinase PhoR